MGQVDPLAPNTHQIHDFNLDIVPFPDGLFWTRRVPQESLAVSGDDLDDGATMDVEHLDVEDYHTLLNSFMDGALSGSEPAEVSYHTRWSGEGTALSGSGATFRFSGIKTTATIEWTAEKAGFRFESDPASTSFTNFALLANEANGVFK